MLAFKNRSRPTRRWPPAQPYFTGPVHLWALPAVAVSSRLFPGALSTGCIQFIFGQSSCALKADSWRVNTLDPGCKHLSYVCLVLVFTDQNHFGRRVLKVWQPDKLHRIPCFSHTGFDYDSLSIWTRFFSGTEHLLKYIFLSNWSLDKNLNTGWLRKTCFGASRLLSGLWGDRDQRRSLILTFVFRFWRPWPPHFIFPLGYLVVVILGYLGDGKATRIPSWHLCCPSWQSAICFWSLKTLGGHTSALHWVVGRKAPTVPCERKGSRGWEADPVVLPDLPWPLYLDSYTWVEGRHLGLVSGREALDCARRCGSVWGAELGKSDRALTGALCSHKSRKILPEAPEATPHLYSGVLFCEGAANSLLQSENKTKQNSVFCSTALWT